MISLPPQLLAIRHAIFWLRLASRHSRHPWPNHISAGQPVVTSAYIQVIAVIDQLTTAGVAKVVVLTDPRKSGSIDDWLSRPVGDAGHLHQP